MNCLVACRFKIVLFCLVSLAFSPNAQAIKWQETRNDQEPTRRFSLGYEDPMMLEYAEVTPEQIEKINAIKQEWQTELDGIRKEKASRQAIRKAYTKSRMRCDAVLDMEQLRKCRRYNLLWTWGPDELMLLSRAIGIGDPEFDKDQLASFEEIKKSWLRFADEKFNVDSTGTYDKAKRDEVMATIGKIRDQYQEKLSAELSELLTESQKVRFEQIDLQSKITVYGLEAFAGEEVANELDFSASQKAELKDLLDMIENETVKYLAVSMRFDGYKKFFESMSEEQKNIWRQKLGRPFPVNNVRWFQEFMEADQKSETQNQK